MGNLKFTSNLTSILLLYLTLFSCKTIPTESAPADICELHKNYSCVGSCIYDLGGPAPVDPHYKAQGLSHGRPGRLTEAIIEMRGACINYCTNPDCSARHGGRECINCRLVGECSCTLNEYWKWWPSGNEYGDPKVSEVECKY